MADLCFLVQHYELAYSCYHTAKKDFLSDQAMLYAAGALVGAHVTNSLMLFSTLVDGLKLWTAQVERPRPGWRRLTPAQVSSLPTHPCSALLLSLGNGSSGSVSADWSSATVSNSLHGHGHPNVQGYLQV